MVRQPEETNGPQARDLRWQLPSLLTPLLAPSSRNLAAAEAPLTGHQGCVTAAARSASRALTRQPRPRTGGYEEDGRSLRRAGRGPGRQRRPGGGGEHHGAEVAKVPATHDPEYVRNDLGHP